MCRESLESVKRLLINHTSDHCTSLSFYAEEDGEYLIIIFPIGRNNGIIDSPEYSLFYPAYLTTLSVIDVNNIPNMTAEMDQPTTAMGDMDLNAIAIGELTEIAIAS